MSEIAWIDEALASARPQVLAGLLRWFKDLDAAEEAFQEASLRALRHWPKNGPPRDPSAWLLFVGKNAVLDGLRQQRREVPLPPEEELSDREDAEAAAAARIDDGDYRDDILRLLFVCCHAELPATQQLALALRIVCGLSVKQIARAFLVTEAAMEQRITRAKATVARAGVPFAAPTASERAERLAAVSTAVYLLFNEGYSAAGSSAPARVPLCDEAIRLGRVLLQVFPSDPSLMGLLALMLLQHSRARARFTKDGTLVLLDDQDRTLWDQDAIAEGLVLVDEAERLGAPDPYQVQAAIAAVHARARRPAETDWAEIDRQYARLEWISPSPIITLNRAVAVWKVQGPAAALAMIEPLADRLDGYFHFHGVKGGLLLELRRASEARAAFNRAIGLATTPAEAAHIRMHLDRLAEPAS